MRRDVTVGRLLPVSLLTWSRMSESDTNVSVPTLPEISERSERRLTSETLPNGGDDERSARAYALFSEDPVCCAASSRSRIKYEFISSSLVREIF